jgi:hypothetical protein
MSTMDETNPSGDFIEVYDGALAPAMCAALIERFNAGGEAGRGETGGGVDVSYKNSWDITISGKPHWRDAEAQLNEAMLRAFLHYLRKYAYTVLGPMWLRLPDPKTGERRTLDPQALAALPDDILRAIATKAFRPGSINLQKYIADQGGYPRWHCEYVPNRGDPDSLYRTLLWTAYLNDGFGDGETEFYHQRRRIAPKTGSLLIAPAAFTHTHRGNMPKGGDKYIATSWILFQRLDVGQGSTS